MKTYTTDEIFAILGAISCERDLIEIEHYVLSNESAFAWYDVIIIKQCIEDLYSIIKH